MTFKVIKPPPKFSLWPRSEDVSPKFSLWTSRSLHPPNFSLWSSRSLNPPYSNFSPWTLRSLYPLLKLAPDLQGHFKSPLSLASDLAARMSSSRFPGLPPWRAVRSTSTHPSTMAVRTWTGKPRACRAPRTAKMANSPSRPVAIIKSDAVLNPRWAASGTWQKKYSKNYNILLLT